MARIIYKIEGKRVPSVTTVLSLLNKPMLVKWANNLGLQGINSTGYVNNLAEIGTLAHYFVECDCNNTEPDLEKYSINQIEIAKTALIKWHKWVKEINFKPIKNEMSLTHADLKFGGTIDLYSMVNGMKTLIDIKTSNSLYLEHYIQLSAYAKLLTHHGNTVDRVMIVRIGRNPNEGFQVKELFTDDLNELFKIFKLLLDVYNLKKSDIIKNLLKKQTNND